jgi:hypothetical protein
LAGFSQHRLKASGKDVQMDYGSKWKEFCTNWKNWY